MVLWASERNVGWMDGWSGWSGVDTPQTVMTTEAPVVIISTSLAETELLAMSSHYYQYQSLHFVHIKVFA